jgi:Protein of unknown function (DUF3892)
MAKYHITCTTKGSSACAPGGYKHITHVGYVSGGTSVITRAKMVALLDSKENTAYTTGGGETAEVKAYDCDKCDTRFLKTTPDDTKADNLHNLPDC